MARLWVNAINRYGGDATFVSLPEIGIRGNTPQSYGERSLACQTSHSERT